MSPAAAEFWRQYGIDSQSDMEAVVEQVFPPLLPFGNLGSDDFIANQAYAFPWGPVGLSVQMYVKRQGYSGDPGSAVQTMLDLARQAAAIALQETSMSTLIIPNCFQVTIQAENNGVAVDNVIGVQNAAGSASAAAVAVKSAWEIADGPLSQLNDQYVMIGYKAVDIGSADGDISVEPSTGTGGGSGSISTAAACALIQWNGSTRSRSSRGRLYYGPLGEGAINADGRTIDATVKGIIDTAFSDFRSQLAAAGYPLVVFSRTLSASFNVTQHTVEGVVATQRRRIRG